MNVEVGWSGVKGIKRNCLTFKSTFRLLSPTRQGVCCGVYSRSMEHTLLRTSQVLFMTFHSFSIQKLRQHFLYLRSPSTVSRPRLLPFFPSHSTFSRSSGRVEVYRVATLQRVVAHLLWWKNRIFRLTIERGRAKAHTTTVEVQCWWGLLNKLNRLSKESKLSEKYKAREKCGAAKRQIYNFSNLSRELFVLYITFFLNTVTSIVFISIRISICGI